MININTPEGQVKLDQEQLLLLQKACHRAEQDAKELIYDLRVYYKTDNDLLTKLRKESESYQNLRILFEDLENLAG